MIGEHVRPLALAWMVVIFFLSSLEPTQLGPPPPPGFDKLVHAVLFGLLVLSFAPHPYRYRNSSEWVPFALGCSVVFALSDELTQSLVPGRVPDALDFVADVVGASAAAGVASTGWFTKLRCRILLVTKPAQS